jgi:BirA family transcriptional regulator, biotin operon repressor / biotin---[acetyl-CoA-carboxylase] ligase
LANTPILCGVLGPDARLALAATRFTDVRHVDRTASTNGAVAALCRRGAPEGVVVVADHQTAGRGRRGRTWVAPPGTSLLVSVLLRPAAAEAHLAAMSTGLAALAACARAGVVGVSLKWPNDLVAGRLKLGGILAEMVDGAVVVGLGLNVDWRTPLPAGAVDLRRLAGRAVDREELLVALLLGLDERCRRPGATIVAEYRSRCATLGRAVRVELAGGTVTGTAAAVDDQGRLLLDTDGGRRVVSAGDVVHLR